MRSSKKGNQWYFGMKAHIGVDARSGLVHTVGVTSGSVHDATVMDRLIRDDDTAVYGDKGYASAKKRRRATCRGDELRSGKFAPMPLTRSGKPRRCQPWVRVMLVLAQVSSMKTRRAGSMRP